MTRVIVAASINNELRSKDITAVKRLQQAGYDIQFYYYLPRVPAEFSMIPSFNEELKNWREHSIKMLKELGEKLNIPAENLHFADEVLGSDQVFDAAKAAGANAILTNDANQLKQTFLSRVYDRIGGLFTGNIAKEVPVENVNEYAGKELGRERPSPRKTEETTGFDEAEVHTPIWSKKTEASLRSRGQKATTKKDEQAETQEEEKTPKIKR